MNRSTKHILNAVIAFTLAGFIGLVIGVEVLSAQGTRLLSTPVSSPTPTATAEPQPTPRTDITQKTEEAIEPLEKLLEEQELGPMWPLNPVKYAIRSSVASGVPANTIVLLLLLPVVAAVIAAARHLIGLRGFGIFLPAALSVVFVAIGPVLGIALFVVIILMTILIRTVIKKAKIRLQYLPRMAMILLFVVVGVLLVLFAAPILRQPDLANVSIFPVLILVLLAEDFTRVQMGKSAEIAINLTTETLILALVSYVFLTSEMLRAFALMYPELLLFGVLVFDFVVGKYIGLRLLEYFRFRRLIES